MEERTKGWKGWSTNERVAAVILLSVLAVFLTLLGLLLYEPPIGPGLCGAFGPTPCPGRENLNFVSATVNSPTNMTVQIWNTGSVAIWLISYHVTYSTYSQPYQSNNWLGPTLGPSTYATINLLIDGNAFTFQSGTYYSITFVTSRNSQFSSTLKAS
jgi:hypothetical protein